MTMSAPKNGLRTALSFDMASREIAESNWVTIGILGGTESGRIYAEVSGRDWRVSLE